MHDLRKSLQLYLVTDRRFQSGETLASIVDQAIQGGVTIVQHREKEASSKNFYEEALQLKKITTRHHVPLIINDRLDIALAVNADGVHIGQDDLPAHIARNILGDDKIIGVSAATLDEALKAEEDGANYIGVGAFFSTTTKHDTRTVTLTQLAEIKENVSIPIVAIGGINVANTKDVVTSGADGIAVVSAILNDPNPDIAAGKLLQEVVQAKN